MIYGFNAFLVFKAIKERIFVSKRQASATKLINNYFMQKEQSY